MDKQIRIFKLNKATKLPDLVLGEPINPLLKNGIVSQIEKEDKVEYRYNKNENIWIGVKKDLVKHVFFTRDSGKEFFQIDTSSVAYPDIGTITDHFSKTFELLEDVKSMEELNSSPLGNYLILIFNDFNLNSIFFYKN